MKKRLIKRITDEIFPSCVERQLRGLTRNLDGLDSSIIEIPLIVSDYKGLPYTIFKKFFYGRLTSYESELRGIVLPVYRDYGLNILIERITKDLIQSANGVGISNPDSPEIVVSVDGVPTDEPKPLEIYFPKKSKHHPRISGRNDEAVTELTRLTRNTYDFYIEHKDGFDEALRLIDFEYPYKPQERETILDKISRDCGLGFIKLQSRWRVGIQTPEGAREFNRRVQEMFNLMY